MGFASVSRSILLVSLFLAAGFTVASRQLPPPPRALQSSAADITPSNLRVIVGPLIPRKSNPSSQISAYDARFVQYERGHWKAYQDAADKVDHAIIANHYGALRSRLSWAIRTGQPIGPAATSTEEHAYARGRAVLRSYLQYSKANEYNIPPHNSTGLPDIEALYLVDGDIEAREHIHRFAAMAAYQFRRAAPAGQSYVQLGTPNTEIRWIYEALQAFGAAHRLDIPYSASRYDAGAIDPAVSSWIGAGERQIAHVASAMPADGSLPMAGEDGCPGCENLLFNLELATELLKWDTYVRSNAAAVRLSRKIMAHVLAVWDENGRRTLPYQNLAGASNAPAPDLAGYVVWPAFATCRETQDERYCALAEHHLAATRQAYIEQPKQFNQTYSTRAQSAEAFKLVSSPGNFTQK